MTLREFFKSEKIKQLDVADKLNIDPSLLCLWLRGTKKIPSHQLECLIWILGLNIDEILEMSVS
jgi:transcriptional regulator with XRE-family HTH domain